MARLRLSVAMCTYNGEPFLGDQLASVAAQTRSPDEIVICDDGSTDGTRGLLDAFAARAPYPVRIFSNERALGSTKNFERVIGLCEGDVIVLSDQDDVWLPRKLERLESSLDGAPEAGAAFSDAELVDEALRPVGRRLWQTVGFDAAGQRRLLGQRAAPALLKQNVVTGATMAFRARFRDFVLPIPASWVHDAWIAALLAATSALTFVPEPLIRYRLHPRQQLGTPRGGVREQVEALLSRRQEWAQESLARIEEEIGRCRALLDRLTRAPATPQTAEWRRCVADKLAHYQARRGLRVSGSRLGRVVAELVRGRYARYSPSVLAAAKDLCA